MKEWIKLFQQILLWLTRPTPPAIPHAPPQTFTPPEKSKKEIFYDLMVRRLDSQAQRIDEVTAHAGNWLSGTGLLIAFPGLLLAAERNDLDTDTFRLIGGAGIVYIIGLFLVFISPLILA